jgi:hypothetical protein
MVMSMNVRNITRQIEIIAMCRTRRDPGLDGSRLSVTTVPCPFADVVTRARRDDE